MSELKKAYKKLQEVDVTVNADIEKFEQDRATCRAELSRAAAVMETTEDPDEYKRASLTVRDNKHLIDLYSKKIEQLKCRLDPTEVMNICNALHDEYDNMQRNTAERCNKLLAEIVTELQALEEQGREFEMIAGQLQEYANIPVNRRKIVAPISLSNKICGDPAGTWKFFINDFYACHKVRLDTLKRYPVNF